MTTGQALFQSPPVKVPTLIPEVRGGEGGRTESRHTVSGREGEAALSGEMRIAKPVSGLRLSFPDPSVRCPGGEAAQHSPTRCTFQGCSPTLHLPGASPAPQRCPAPSSPPGAGAAEHPGASAPRTLRSSLAPSRPRLRQCPVRSLNQRIAHVHSN